MLVEAHWKKISLGKYYFPANFHFACCESQGFYYFVSWWFTAWAWCWHNCLKRYQIFRRPKQAIRPRQNAPSLCRILKLRESSSEQVLNNKRQKILSFWRPKKSYPFANFSILDFTRTTGTNSSLLSKMTFALKMTKFTIFSKAKEKYFLLHKYRSF